VNEGREVFVPRRSGQVIRIQPFGAQSPLASFIEACMNTASGFVVSLLFWTYVVVPVWNLPVTMSQNLIITGCFTVLSVARSYIWRRVFNKEIPQRIAQGVSRYVQRIA
jgi:hypothetical protein